MPNQHFILQGKGGVGKSFIAAMLAQFLATTKKAPPLCIDTDPVNGTLHSFSSLKATKIQLLEANEINPLQFDTLVETGVTSKSDVIIDNGASSFIPLSHYLLTNEIHNVLADNGHTFVIHTVITGGQSLIDTLGGFVSLATHFPQSVPFIVWLNPYLGPIKDDGKTFSELKAYKEHKGRISGIVEIPAVKPETFGHDIASMLKARQTFDEAISGANLMAKQRLTIFRRNLFDAISVGLTAL